MNALEKRIEQFCLGCRYDPKIEAVKTKGGNQMLVASGIFVFFSDLGGVRIYEDGDTAFLNEDDAPDFFMRLKKYRDSGGKTSIISLKEKYEKNH